MARNSWLSSLKQSFRRVRGGDLHRRSTRLASTRRTLLEPLEERHLLAADLITNGSFERAGGGGYFVSAGSTAIGGWEVIGGAASSNVFWYRNGDYGAFVQDGSYALDLSGNDSFPFGEVRQSIVTTPGQEYRLSFYLGSDGRWGYGNRGPVGMTASIGGVEYSFWGTGDTSSRSLWELQTQTFTASSNSTTIVFSTPSVKPVHYIGLDDVSVEAAAPPNEAPEITSDGGGDTASLNIAENTAAVTNVDSTDPEGETENGGGLTYSLSGPDEALFSIDAAGNLAFSSAPDFEDPGDFGGDNVYDVTVTVSDTGDPVLTDSQDIAVTVTDVNEPPSVALTNTTSSLVENTDTSNRIKVADIEVTDDALGTNTLSVSGVDAIMFEIDGDELFLKVGSTVDFEANPVLDVTVEVDDSTVGVTPDDLAALAIAVIDIDPLHVTCAVIDEVQGLKDVGDLSNGEANPILNHLGQAKKDYNKGNTAHAVQKLGQGRDEIQDLIDDGELDAFKGNLLIDDINDVITEILSGSA